MAVHGHSQGQLLHLEPLDGFTAQLIKGDDVRHMDTPGDERSGAAHGGEEELWLRMRA